MIRRIVLVVLVVASVALIARIQRENVRMTVNPDPIYYFLLDR
ncbi:MAG: hypothetical protein WA823_09435 [Candidatus Acidiferrales bacterium]